MTIPYNIYRTSMGVQIAEHFYNRGQLKQYVYIVPETATINGQKG